MSLETRKKPPDWTIKKLDIPKLQKLDTSYVDWTKKLYTRIPTAQGWMIKQTGYPLGWIDTFEFEWSRLCVDWLRRSRSWRGVTRSRTRRRGGWWSSSGFSGKGGSSGPVRRWVLCSYTPRSGAVVGSYTPRSGSLLGSYEVFFKTKETHLYLKNFTYIIEQMYFTKFEALPFIKGNLLPTFFLQSAVFMPAAPDRPRMSAPQPTGGITSFCDFLIELARAGKGYAEIQVNT